MVGMMTNFKSCLTFVVCPSNYQHDLQVRNFYGFSFLSNHCHSYTRYIHDVKP